MRNRLQGQRTAITFKALSTCVTQLHAALTGEEEVSDSVVADLRAGGASARMAEADAEPFNAFAEIVDRCEHFRKQALYDMF